MRCAVRWIVLLSLEAFTGVAATGPNLLWAQCNQNCPEKRAISVTGAGVVTADADLAIVRVGYKLYGPDARGAYAGAVQASNAIMEALTASGIPKDTIESTSQILHHTPVYELGQLSNSADRVQREFTVTQSWVIRIKPDDASRTLNTAINAGANESGWIEWVIQDPGSLQARAAASAVADARTTAEAVAQKSGVRLGHLVSVSENQGAPAPDAGPLAMNGGAYGLGVGAMDAIQFGNQQLAINSRRVRFVVQVFAEFAIE
jgi:uncharacterized protein